MRLPASMLPAFVLPALLCLLVVPGAASAVVPLRAGLQLTSELSRRGDVFETTLRVEAVDARKVKVVFTGRRADGSPSSATRTVRIRDLADARSLRPNFVDGASEYFEGATAFGASAAVLADLRAGRPAAVGIDVGGLTMAGGVADSGLAREIDGMLGDMGGFAGISDALEAAAARGSITEAERADAAGTMDEIDQLQVAKGDLRAHASTGVDVQVNGKPIRLPAIEARGRVQAGDAAHDVVLVFLDDPANPLLLASDIGAERTQVVRIDYPAAP